MSWLQTKLNGKHARLGSRRPTGRTDELIVEQLDNEVLVYDQRSDQAHCLSSTAGNVWRACDGNSTVQELSVSLQLDADTVARALAELEECGLLDAAPGAGVTRREVTARFAKYGAAVASAPLIYSIVAPTPALAASQNFCVGLGCVKDCGVCHQAHCSCCGPGNSTTSADKLCTADCSSTNCNDTLRAAHCGTVSPSAACN